MNRQPEYDHEVKQDRKKVDGVPATERFTSDHWGTVEGREVVIVEFHWRNGEGHAVLQDGRTLPDMHLNFDFDLIPE